MRNQASEILHLKSENTKLRNVKAKLWKKYLSGALAIYCIAFLVLVFGYDGTVRFTGNYYWQNSKANFGPHMVTMKNREGFNETSSEYVITSYDDLKHKKIASFDNLHIHFHCANAKFTTNEDVKLKTKPLKLAKNDKEDSYLLKQITKCMADFNDTHTEMERKLTDLKKNITDYYQALKETKSNFKEVYKRNNMAELYKTVENFAMLQRQIKDFEREPECAKELGPDFLRLFNAAIAARRLSRLVTHVAQHLQFESEIGKEMLSEIENMENFERIKKVKLILKHWQRKSLRKLECLQRTVKEFGDAQIQRRSCTKKSDMGAYALKRIFQETDNSITADDLFGHITSTECASQ